MGIEAASFGGLKKLGFGLLAVALVLAVGAVLAVPSSWDEAFFAFTSFLFGVAGGLVFNKMHRLESENEEQDGEQYE